MSKLRRRLLSMKFKSKFKSKYAANNAKENINELVNMIDDEIPTALFNNIMKQNPDCVYSGKVYLEVAEDTWEDSIEDADPDFVVLSYKDASLISGFGGSSTVSGTTIGLDYEKVLQKHGIQPGQNDNGVVLTQIKSVEADPIEEE